jgi:RimJ/RimL family protein N-acetyltransferase
MKYSRTHLPDPSLEYTKTKLDPCLPGNGAYMFAIILRVDGEQRGLGGEEVEELVGDVGVHEFEYDEEYGGVVGEVGYLLREDLWGRGLGTEALRAFLENWWSLERKGSAQADGAGGRDGKGDGDRKRDGKKEFVRAVSEEENVGSLRVLENCGFKERGRWRHESGDRLVGMVLERPDPYMAASGI